MIGHLLGAAGGIECIATALAVKNDIMPATINYETPDRKSTRLNSSHEFVSRMPSSA